MPPPAAAPAAAAPTAAAAAPAAAAKKKSSLDSYRMRGDPVTAQEFIANAGLLAIGARGELAPGTSVVFFLEGYLSGALADSRLRLSEHLTSEQDEPLQSYELCTVQHAAFAREKGTASVAGLSSLFALKRHGEASGVFAVDNVPDSDCPNYLVLAEDFTRGMSAGWAAGDRVEMYFPQEERPLTHGEWYGGTIKAVDAGRMAVNGWDAVTIEFDQNPGHPQQVNPWELRRVGGADEALPRTCRTTKEAEGGCTRAHSAGHASRSCQRMCGGRVWCTQVQPLHGADTSCRCWAATRGATVWRRTRSSLLTAAACASSSRRASARPSAFRARSPCLSPCSPPKWQHAHLRRRSRRCERPRVAMYTFSSSNNDNLSRNAHPM